MPEAATASAAASHSASASDGPNKRDAAADAAADAASPDKSKPALDFFPLNRVPPRWRMLAAAAIGLLLVACVVLTITLSVVLSRHHAPPPPGQPAFKPGFTPLVPPSYPLAVRNPYLSAWIPGRRAAKALPRSQAHFWGGQPLGWAVLARVDGKAYSLFGTPELAGDDVDVEAAKVVGGEYTSTRSAFHVEAGGVRFSLDFLSPAFVGADAASLVQQSLPLSFLTVSAALVDPRRDPRHPEVSVYSDIDNKWLGPPPDRDPAFSLRRDSEAKTHVWTWESTRQGNVYQEKNNMALWGQVLYASRAKEGAMTMAFGKEDDVRKQFVQNGTLDELKAPVPQWNGSGTPVSAYAHSLGRLGAKPQNVTFGVAMVRDLAVRFYGTDYAPYYKTKYPKRADTVTAVADAFSALEVTRETCEKLDRRVHDASVATGGANYSHITTLSVRQVLGAVDVTVPAGTLDASNATAWMKEISSNGDIQTLDIIYPAIPFFYWISPGYIQLLLRPILQYLEMSRLSHAVNTNKKDAPGWPHPWAVHDLGDRAYQNGGYPRAAGHDNGRSEQMPLESTGNLLILAYMHQRATGSQALGTQYRALLDGYARYLRANGLQPAAQLATNDGAGKLANQTNLAVKAAVALNAHAHMFSNDTAAREARDMARTIGSKSHGLSDDGSHLLLAYHEPKTWGLMFNLYPDTLLNLSTFSPGMHALQARAYAAKRAEAGKDARGLPIDSRGDYGSSNWMFFCGAADPEGRRGKARRAFLADVHAYLVNGLSELPFDDRFFVSGHDAGRPSPGGGKAFRARPVVGGHFAVLAREEGAGAGGGT